MNDTTARCRTVGGVGTNWSVVVEVALQSGVSTSGLGALTRLLCICCLHARAVDYAVPSIVTVRPVALGSTRGGRRITLVLASLTCVPDVHTIVQTGNNLAADPPVALPVDAPSAVYGPWTAINCSANASARPQTLVCLTSEGAGAGWAWSATVGGQTSSPSGDSTAYSPPNITKVSPTVNLSTVGGEVLTIEGNDFGPLASASSLNVSLELSGASSFSFPLPNCTWHNHSRIDCVTVEAAGQPRVVVRVMDQGGGGVVTVSYAPPVVQDVTVLPIASTLGGDSVTVTGASFGPPSAWNTAVTISVVPLRFAIEFVGPCVVQSQGQLNCTLPPGVGANLTFAVTASGQRSATLGTDRRYSSPSVSAVSPSVVPADDPALVVNISGAGDRNAPPRPGDR